MHTSPSSTGVASCPGTNDLAASDSLSSWVDVYCVNTFDCSARANSVLSTPHITSPSGFPAVSAAFDSIAPASPEVATLTAIPVSLVKVSNADGSSVNESYATIVSDDGFDSFAFEPLLALLLSLSSPHDTASKVTATASRRKV